MPLGSNMSLTPVDLPSHFTGRFLDFIYIMNPYLSPTSNFFLGSTITGLSCSLLLVFIFWLQGSVKAVNTVLEASLINSQRYPALGQIGVSLFSVKGLIVILKFSLTH
ncbi:hypothetical protein Droror1_Dr00011075 [Drosera rotundifolia]